MNKKISRLCVRLAWDMIFYIKYYYVDQIKEDVCEACSTHEEVRNAYKILVWKA
jgi:hypothetical protein